MDRCDVNRFLIPIAVLGVVLSTSACEETLELDTGMVCEGSCWNDGDDDGFSEIEGDCDDANPDIYPGVSIDCPNMDGSVDTGDTEPPPIPENGLVTGLTITEVAIFQGVKIPLMEGGTPFNVHDTPIIGLRDGMIRVYIERLSEWNARNVTAILDFQSEEATVESMEITGMVNGDSKEAQLNTTFNFQVPGSYLKGDLSYQIRLTESDEDLVVPGDSSGAQWPLDDDYQSLGEKYVGEQIRLVLVPVLYGADGSNRAPDTSNSQIERYRSTLFSRYPAPEIEITVREPMNWQAGVYASGTGWSELLDGIQNLRSLDNAEDDEYYYGIFEPDTSMNDYCGWGCTTGLSIMPYSPNQSFFFASIGLGFSGDSSAETMSHELGHAHGRDHAPCGVSGGDNEYPYANARLGTWGYDLIEESLKDPDNYADMMSYCDPQWISDYNYDQIYDWVRSVNLLNFDSQSHQPSQWQALNIHEDNTIEVVQDFTFRRPPTGAPVNIRQYSDTGFLLTTSQGILLQYSHLPTQRVYLPKPAPGVHSIEVVGYGAVIL